MVWFDPCCAGLFGISAVMCGRSAFSRTLAIGDKSEMGL